MQFSIDELLRAGKFPGSTVGDPGVQGAGVTGTQGIGVRTPKAADVADATVGFAREVHIPKGIMLVMGMLSMILASGVWVKTLFLGRTTSELGARPKLHCNVAPIHTRNGIILTSGWLQRIPFCSFPPNGTWKMRLDLHCSGHRDSFVGCHFHRRRVKNLFFVQFETCPFSFSRRYLGMGIGYPMILRNGGKRGCWFKHNL